MWQRFTEPARKAVFYAQEDAQESDSVAARTLEKLGLSRIRVEVVKQLPRGGAQPGQDLTLTPRAKRVMDLAYDEARNLNNSTYGSARRAAPPPTPSP